MVIKVCIGSAQGRTSVSITVSNIDVDIAVGAPYEDNGAVYIYLGGANGLISKPSQRLAAPYNGNVAPFTPHMFGQSLSKGSDIDQNNYLGKQCKYRHSKTIKKY